MQLCDETFVLAARIALLAGALLASSAGAADLSIRFAWSMPPHTATSDQAEAIARRIRQTADGEIQVKTYPSGSLATESTMGQAIANNTANMGIVAMHWWSGQEPALEWDTIPFLADDVGRILDALHGKLGRNVNELLNKHGVEIVGWGFYGFAESYVNTKHPIRVPKDLDGLKMRSEGSLNAEFLKRFGAIPVAVDSSEVYTALQRGTLDGAASGMASIVSRKWYEVGRYITAIHYVPLVYPVQVNLDWWNGLTEAQRRAIRKAVAETESANVRAIESSFSANIEVAQKQGDQVYRPSPDERAEWRRAAYDMAVSSYLSRAGDAGRRLIEDVREAMSDSRDEARP